MFNSLRLTIARQRAGLTKKELAARIGVEPRAISGFEADQYAPTDDNIKKMARILGFSEAFLCADDIEILSAEGVSFRSMSKMTAKQRDAAIAAGSIAYTISDWVDRNFALPALDLPDYSGADPETAAISLRKYWGLGELPIKNMIHLLELKGIRVFSLAQNCAEVDAYSVWRGARPFVFLNTRKSGERRRFDAAHELAHLVLHRHSALSGPDVEKEAHQFAAAFLMPLASMKSIGRITPTLPFIYELKKRWMVSAAAMVMRLYNVKMLTYHYYNQLFSEISRKGYRTNEPYPIKPETSQIWHKIFSQLRKEGVGVDALSEQLLLPQDEIVKLVFGLVTIGLPNGAPTIVSGRPSPKLTVVK